MILVATIDTLPGYDVVEVFGDVLGVTARPQNAFIEGARSLNGAPNHRQPETLSAIRRDAVARMRAVARRHGANAVLGMRFDHRAISSNWTEICAYGTAVLVVPNQR